MTGKFAGYGCMDGMPQLVARWDGGSLGRKYGLGRITDLMRDAASRTLRGRAT